MGVLGKNFGFWEQIGLGYECTVLFNLVFSKMQFYYIMEATF